MSTDDQANRRLLDMLAGWEVYLDKCTNCTCHDDVPKTEYEREVLVVAQLYLDAGQKDFTPEERREFLLSRILPFLEGEQ